MTTGQAQSTTAMTRRGFLSALTMAGAHALVQPMSTAWAQGDKAPALVTSDHMRPGIPYGVASGDITHHSAIVWSRADRPSRLMVEYATTESMRDAHRIQGPAALEATDFTAKLDLIGLPAGQRIFYRVYFEDLATPKHYSEPVTGSFLTAPLQKRDLHIMWSGDTAGQGFGINPDWGGMKIYHTMHQMQPDLFIHSGDYIYADGPIEAEVALDDGGIWKNLTTPEKAKVAETMAEFRGNYAYNLLDAHVRRFNAAVPQLVQWDDHETLNNWYPGEQLLDDDRYTVKSASLLAARGKRALFEYTPIRDNLMAPERIHRAFSYGPSLDIFMLDMRSYRGPNTYNRQPNAGADTAFLGSSQIAWLKHHLRTSRATWKVIASDMPIGLIVPDGNTAFENLSNGDGMPLGRELEMADLLHFIKTSNLANVVWLTADVHYAAAHYYDPNKAQFQDFAPFWEFVAGPLNAGTFGPNDLDNTFGPQVVFKSIPDEMKPKRPPSDGLQFFGSVRVDGKTEVMTVSLYNLEGAKIYGVNLEPGHTRS
jgi:alkaline phosphatase D